MLPPTTEAEVAGTESAIDETGAARSSGDAVDSPPAEDPSLAASGPQGLPLGFYQFLEANPEYMRVTVEDVDLKEEFEAGFLDPYTFADTNADGMVDLVALLVVERLSAIGVFHGPLDRVPLVPVWLDLEEGDVISGVYAERGWIMPVYCTECDANPYHIWSGSEYELEYIQPGEVLCVMADSPLYSEPSVTSAVVFRTTTTVRTDLVALGIDGDGGEWYEVVLRTSDANRGWVGPDRSYGPNPLCED